MSQPPKYDKDNLVTINKDIANEVMNLLSRIINGYLAMDLSLFDDGKDIIAINLERADELKNMSLTNIFVSKDDRVYAKNNELINIYDGLIGITYLVRHELNPKWHFSSNEIAVVILCDKLRFLITSIMP